MSVTCSASPSRSTRTRGPSSVRSRGGRDARHAANSGPAWSAEYTADSASRPSLAIAAAASRSRVTSARRRERVRGHGRLDGVERRRSVGHDHVAVGWSKGSAGSGRHAHDDARPPRGQRGRVDHRRVELDPHDAGGQAGHGGSLPERAAATSSPRETGWGAMGRTAGWRAIIVAPCSRSTDPLPPMEPDAEVAALGGERRHVAHRTGRREPLGPPAGLVTRLVAARPRAARRPRERSAAASRSIRSRCSASAPRSRGSTAAGRRASAVPRGCSPAADGWMAVSLARPDDVALGAGLAGARSGRRRPVDGDRRRGPRDRRPVTLVERARLLGLPGGGAGRGERGPPCPGRRRPLGADAAPASCSTGARWSSWGRCGPDRCAARCSRRRAPRS